MSKKKRGIEEAKLIILTGINGGKEKRRERDREKERKKERERERERECVCVCVCVRVYLKYVHSNNQHTL